MRDRGYDADSRIDDLEERWWNENAETIEEAWALTGVLRRGVRAHYLRVATAFFLSNARTLPVTVFEVGCGSGWVGRLMAESGRLNVVGTDLSSSQISLAEKSALIEGLSDRCSYRVGNLAALRLQGRTGSSCVLVHAILHHLSWREIHTVLAEISALGRGASVFVYEPVELEKPSQKLSLPFKVWRRVAQWLVKSLVTGSQALLGALDGERNEMLASNLERLGKQAQDNGWVLSPKEVVFREAELLGVLRDRFEIKQIVMCNFLSLTLGQQAGLYHNPSLHNWYARLILPVARAFDQLLFRTGVLPFVASEHVFMGYLCQVR